MTATEDAIVQQELFAVRTLLGRSLPTTVADPRALLVEWTGCPRPDAVLTCSMQLRSLDEALQRRVHLTHAEERALAQQATLSQRVQWLRERAFLQPRRLAFFRIWVAIAGMWFAILLARFGLPLRKRR